MLIVFSVYGLMGEDKKKATNQLTSTLSKNGTWNNQKNAVMSGPVSH